MNFKNITIILAAALIVAITVPTAFGEPSNISVNVTEEGYEIVHEENNENLESDDLINKFIILYDDKITTMSDNLKTKTFENSIQAIPNTKIIHEYKLIPAVVVSVNEPEFTKRIQNNMITSLSDLPNVKAVFPVEKLNLSLMHTTNKIGSQSLNIDGVTGSGVNVCVVDTGIDDSHYALPTLLHEYDFVNDDDDATDDHGHGTHVAGIIASSDLDYKGVAPGSSLMAAKVFDASGRGTSDVAIEGIEWCVNNGADVISLSLGAGSFPSECQDNSALALASNVAVENGVVVVAASGNDSYYTLLNSPACASDVISVGSTISHNDLSLFSNSHPLLDVLAPGQSISSTGLSDDFVRKSGTSMSTPYVSGAVALLLQENPELTPQEIRSVLQNTALDYGYPGFDDLYGYGGVSAFHAYHFVSNSTLTHLKFEENTNDLSPFDNFGVVSGNENYIIGLDGYSFDFDGSTHVELQNESDFDFSITDPFTLSFWMKSSNEALTYESLLAKKDTSGKGWEIGIDTDGKILFYLGEDESTNLTIKQNFSIDIRDDKWHHVAISYDGIAQNSTGTIIQIDHSKLKTTITDNLSADANVLNDVNVIIGSDNQGTSPFTGQIDNLLIHKTALSSFQINESYVHDIYTSPYTEPPSEFLFKFGLEGSHGNGHFIDLKDVAVGPDQKIYAVDNLFNGQVPQTYIQIFDENGTFLSQFEVIDTFSGGFLPQTWAVAVDDEHIYVSVVSHSELHVYNHAGELQSKVDVPSRGFISDIQVYLDRVYTTSVGVVQVRDLDGVTLFSIGSYCTVAYPDERCIDPDGEGPLKLGDGQFSSPMGIEIFDDKLYVADRNNHRIQVFDLEGNFLYIIAEDVAYANRDIEIAPDGTKFILDEYSSYSNTIDILDSDNNVIGGIAEGGRADGEIAYADNIALSGTLLYVADRNNHRIQVFDVSDFIDESIETDTTPIISITQPQDNSVFNQTDTISFNAIAIDAEDGYLTDNITWSSSIDGILEFIGGYFETNSLSAITHNITAAVTDSDDNTATASIVITIQEELFCDNPKSYYDTVIEGTQDDDVLVGNSKNNLILGYGGNDILDGKRGDDCIYGGDGNDVLKGRGGNDILFGGLGDDVLRGHKGTNTLDGGNGTDRCISNSSDVLINCES